MWPSIYMQDKRQILPIVNEKVVISVEIFTLWVGGTSLLTALGNRRVNESACLEHFKTNIMSLGIILLEEKLFMWTDNNDIKIKMC